MIIIYAGNAKRLAHISFTNVSIAIGEDLQKYNDEDVEKIVVSFKGPRESDKKYYILDEANIIFAKKDDIARDDNSSSERIRFDASILCRCEYHPDIASYFVRTRSDYSRYSIIVQYKVDEDSPSIVTYYVKYADHEERKYVEKEDTDEMTQYLSNIIVKVTKELLPKFAHSDVDTFELEY